MKKQIFSIFILCNVCFTLLAQQETYIEHSFNHASRSKLAALEYVSSTNEWIVGHTETSLDNGVPFLPPPSRATITKFNEAGDVIWQIYPSDFFDLGYVNTYLKDMTVVSDSVILAYIYNLHSSDVITDLDSLTLYKISLDGEAVADIKGLEQISSGSGNKHCLSAFSDASYVLSMDETELRSYDENSNLRWLYDVQTPITDILTLDENYTTLAASDSTLLAFDEFGNLTQTLSFDAMVKKVKKWQDGFLLIVGKSLVWLNEDYSTYHTEDFSASFESLSDIDVEENGQAMLLGKDILDKKTLVQTVPIPFTMPPVYSTSFIDSCILAKEIKLGSNTFAIAGEETLCENGYYVPYHAFIKTFDKENGNTDIYDTDIGVIDTWIDNEVYTYNEIWGSEYTFDTHFTVKNFGQDTLHTYHVSYVEKETGVSTFKYLEVNDEALLPNETREFMVAMKYDYIDIDEVFEVCIWTTTPNDKLDRNHANNTYCSDFIVTGINDIEETKIYIAPNPAQQNVTISLPPQIIQQKGVFKIYDTAGRLIKTLAHTQNKLVTTFSVAELPNGIYLLEYLSDTQKTSTTKLVVQH